MWSLQSSWKFSKLKIFSTGQDIYRAVHYSTTDVLFGYQEIICSSWLESLVMFKIDYISKLTDSEQLYNQSLYPYSYVLSARTSYMSNTVAMTRRYDATNAAI